MQKYWYLLSEILLSLKKSQDIVEGNKAFKRFIPKEEDKESQWQLVAKNIINHQSANIPFIAIKYINSKSKLVLKDLKKYSKILSQDMDSTIEIVNLSYDYYYSL